MKKIIFFLLAFTAIITVSAQQLSKSDQNKETVKKMIETLNQKDWADHMRPFFSTTEDYENLKKMHEPFREVFPDYHYEVLMIAAEGDTVITVGKVTGTHTKVWDLFPSIPATGKKVSWIEANVSILKDGKIAGGMLINDRLSMIDEFGYSCKPEAVKL